MPSPSSKEESIHAYFVCGLVELDVTDEIVHEEFEFNITTVVVTVQFQQQPFRFLNSL